MNRVSLIIGMIVGFLAGVPCLLIAQDWYVATGKPVQGSALSSADLRSEFALIESSISAKLPSLTGNAGRVVAVNSAGTALTAATGLRVDSSVAAGETRVLVYDVDNAAFGRMSVGADDSCGSGYRCLRVPN
jgi:hypothetical protein